MMGRRNKAACRTCRPRVPRAGRLRLRLTRRSATQALGGGPGRMSGGQTVSRCGRQAEVPASGPEECAFFLIRNGATSQDLSCSSPLLALRKAGKARPVSSLARSLQATISKTLKRPHKIQQTSFSTPSFLPMHRANSMCILCFSPENESNCMLPQGDIVACLHSLRPFLSALQHGSLAGRHGWHRRNAGYNSLISQTLSPARRHRPACGKQACARGCRRSRPSASCQGREIPVSDAKKLSASSFRHAFHRLPTS